MKNNLIWLLFETHELKCKCSYCYGNNKEHYGLNIPKNKSWNSWWVIKYWDRRYIRWTNSWLKYKSRTKSKTICP
jgi:hypothetical protein